MSQRTITPRASELSVQQESERARVHLNEEIIGSGADRLSALMDDAVLQDLRDGSVVPHGRSGPKEVARFEKLKAELLEHALREAVKLFQAGAECGAEAFATAVRALIRFLPPLPREQHAVFEYGLKLILDPRSAVHQAWHRAAVERLSPNSIQRLEFKGEIAAFVHVLWLALGSQKKAKEETHRIGKSKAARLGLCDRKGEQKRERADGGKIAWRIRTVGTYYEDLLEALPWLRIRKHGQPVLQVPKNGGLPAAALNVGPWDDLRGGVPGYGPEVMRCIEVLMICEHACEDGHDLRTYIEHLAGHVYGATLLPASEKLD